MLSREDRIYEEIEQWEASLHAVREFAIESGDLLLGALTIDGQEEREIEKLRDELKSIEAERVRSSEWSDHWLLDL